MKRKEQMARQTKPDGMSAEDCQFLRGAGDIVESDTDPKMTAAPLPDATPAELPEAAGIARNEEVQISRGDRRMAGQPPPAVGVSGRAGRQDLDDHHAVVEIGRFLDSDDQDDGQREQMKTAGRLIRAPVAMR